MRTATSSGWLRARLSASTPKEVWVVITRNVANRSGRFAAAVFVGLAVIGCGGAAGTTSSSRLMPAATPAATLAVTAPIAPSPVSNSSAAVIDPPEDLSAASTYEQFAPFFDYHVDVAFDIKEKSTRQDAGATIRDITYTSEAGQPVDAYLVVPAGSGPFPAVLFEHGMGDTRDQLVDEAITLAQQQHVVGLVPTRPVTPASTGTNEAILQIREMRHGYDLLASQPGVDKSRLGYVGFSMGAVLGSEIVAFERRIKTAVLIEGVPSVAQNWLDTAALAPHATTASLLFQFGTGDTYYQTDGANAWAALFGSRAHVQWYESGHSPSEVFLTDCTKWLKANL
jgi:dienelactone hydrolase